MERVTLRHLKGSRTSELEEFPLDEFAEVTIGRDPAAAIRFDPDKDDLVGRQHARIARIGQEGYRFILQDLNSRNGTYLNRRRVVGEMPLQPGDVIQLGAGGPEIEFDLVPRPAAFLKPTRLDGAAALGGPVETRLANAVPASANEAFGGIAAVGAGSGGASGAPSGAAFGGAASGGAASGGAASGGAASAAMPPAVGRATVERLIDETRGRGNRNLAFASVGALAVVLAVVGWARRDGADRDRETAARFAATQDSLRLAQQAGLDSLGSQLARPAALATQLQPSEIAARHGAAVVQVDFSWKLTYRATGGQVYHRAVPNQYRGADGRTRPIIDDGRRMVPAYVQVGNTIEPALTLDQNAGTPIGVSSRGSGFVVTESGFVITNRHVAYNWQAPYTLDPREIGPVINPATGAPMLDAEGTPVLTRPPQQWIPSETKQAGPKGDIGDFQARVEYLMVRFPKDPTPFEAKNVRPSQRHDVALIKVDAPQVLTPLTMLDTYDQTRQGDQVVVMGYPGVSDEVITLIKSRDMFNREVQQRVLPEPTLSTGNIGKILRAADAEVRDGFMTFAPGGDTYQLTINSTGGGNSGGPMFDAQGHVIGIYFAGKTADAQISFAVPIRYAMELLRIGDPTAP